MRSRIVGSRVLPSAKRRIGLRAALLLTVLTCLLGIFCAIWHLYHLEPLGKANHSGGGRKTGVNKAPPTTSANLENSHGLKKGLAHKKQVEFCERHFGLLWLEDWNATAKTVCAVNSQNLLSSSMTCRRLDADDHMTEASRPHVMCDASNLLIDPFRASKASCPQYRPGYLCHSPTYHRYARGAFALACDLPELRLEDFPRDHLQDIMESMEEVDAALLSKALDVEDVPTLLVTREVEEHANVFHTMTDLLNVYITTRFLGWGEEQPFHVLLMDNHPPGPLDSLWPSIATGNGTINPVQGDNSGVTRLREMQHPKLYRRAAFVPPGYSSLLFAHLYESNSCPQPSSLFRGFKAWMQHRLGLKQQHATELQVNFVSRRPKSHLTSQKPKPLVRGISNEDEIQASLAELPGISVHTVDLASLDLASQLDLISNTDILIGMHGAALAWALLMREGAALVELWPQQNGIWRCYEHMAEWAGLNYRRWAYPDSSHAILQGRKGDSTQIDVIALQAIAASLVPIVNGTY